MRNRRAGYEHASQMMLSGAPYLSSEIQRVLGDASPDGHYGNVWDRYRVRVSLFGSQDAYDAAAHMCAERRKETRLRGRPTGRIVGKS